MNRKISLGLALALIFVAMAGSVAGTMAVSMKMYNSIIKDLPKRSQTYSLLAEIDDVIRTNYYGEINETLLNADMAEGFANGVGDSYSYYMTASEYDIYKNEMNGQKMGVGIIPVFNEDDMCLYAAEVSDGSPAALNNMTKGDRIVTIDEEEVTVYNYKELVKKLEGEKLSSVNVAFIHDGNLVAANMVKGYTAQTVYYETVGQVGYVKITDFYSTTASQLKNAVNTLIKQGVSGIIIDLRAVSNGTVEYATDALDVLVPVASDGTKALATAVDKNGETIETFTSDADSINVSTVILVNKDTSGPAELFACDMRDFGKAKLVGTATKGNGTMQRVYQLSDGGAVKLTVAEIKPYTSDVYNGVGLTPDYLVELSSQKNNRLALLSHSEDEQYQKANSLLTSSAGADEQ